MQSPVSVQDWGGVWEYKSELFVVLGNIICMILSALVPSASIICLYFVSSMIARLAVVFGMSFLLSFVMTIIVQGCRVGVNGFRSCTSRVCWICEFHPQYQLTNTSTGVGVADLTIGGLVNCSTKAGSCRILAFLPAISLEPRVSSFIYKSEAQTSTGDEIRIVREISHVFLLTRRAEKRELIPFVLQILELHLQIP
jgi:hypothetical protein